MVSATQTGRSPTPISYGAHVKLIVASIVILALAVASIAAFKPQLYSIINPAASQQANGTFGKLNYAEQIDSYLAMGRMPHTIEVSYIVWAPGSGFGASENNSMQASYFELNGSSYKTSMFMGMASTVLYSINGNQTLCSQNPGYNMSCAMMGGNASMMSQQQTSLVSPIYSVPKGAYVSYSGNATIAGRQCDAYGITVGYTNSSLVEQAISSSGMVTGSEAAGMLSGYKGGTFHISMCFDKQYGVVEHIGISYMAPKSQAGQNASSQLYTVYDVTALNFSTNVTQSEFQVP
ncbi:MAG: hypothetical protein KGH98_01645 [Candidatus Micrarchaeota archaeon]|nr:hypothetical protein [Candidatus Micrarchaeota archaeon]